jgi:broad specificity phosphatase PhoE
LIEKMEDANGFQESVIYLMRHGDRWDFAHPEWEVQMRELGYGTWDPSLSPLGHKQARALLRTTFNTPSATKIQIKMR